MSQARKRMVAVSPAFFGELCRAAARTIPRLRVSGVVAAVAGYLHDRSRKRAAGRPCLSAEQAALAGLYFFFTSAKARRELGYEARPLRESLRDAHAFWTSAGRRRVV